MARNARSLLCLFLVVVMLVGCTPTNGPAAEPEKTLAEMSLDERLTYYTTLGSSPDDNYRTWYEIFLYSFCDSNGDGIGDFQGAISKLDYLKELGVNGIWLMPIHPSTSYHKYNVDDYYAIDPAYGTMADFDQFMAECEKRDIHVIMDLVVNHCGSNNPWFKEARDYLKTLDVGDFGDPAQCKYFDYFNFNIEGGKGYSRVPGTWGYYYECQFSGDMPDLNWDSELMKADVKNVMQFWLDKGVAGFRVDAAKEFYTGAVTKNVEVMKWLQQTAESIKPDVYMVAEVWETNYTVIEAYYESGFTSIFNYPFGNSTGKLMQVVNGRGNPNMVKTWATAQETAHKAYAKSHPEYIDAPFLSNHDILRIFDGVSGDPLRVKMAGAMNLFMGGSAFIYYGEEIGMATTGNTESDPSKRAPMYWNAERNEGTTLPCPGCTLPTEYPNGSLKEQQADEGSVYNYYRQAVAIRNALPVIARGVPTAEAALNTGCVSALRKTWNDQQCIILMNVDDDEAGVQVDLTAYADWNLAAILSANGQPITLEDSTLTMPAYGIAILVPKA